MRKTRNRRRSRRRRSRKMRGGMFGLGEGLKKVGSFFGIGNREDNKGEELIDKSPENQTPPMVKQQESVDMDDQTESVPAENQTGGKKRRRRRKSKKRGGGCGCAAPMTGGKRKRRRRRTHKKNRKSRRRRR